jgi:hypothetical protein
MNLAQITWIGIADSAVKIGLGACIAAISAYFMLKRSQDGEFQKELRNRRWTVLQEVAEIVQKTYEAHLNHLQAFTTFKSPNADTPQDARDMAKATFDSLTTDLMVLIKSLSAAEAKLLLLGEKDASHKCGLFGDSIMMDLTQAIDQLADTKNDDKKYAHGAEERRRDVFDCLSKIYQRQE